jgi:probable rRNA maturation factor
MTGIAVINESGVDCDTDALARLAAFLFPLVRVSDDCELCITIVDEPRMEELHIQWMDLPDATDVLSFPMDELRSAEENEELPTGVLGELQFLTTHGILHLLGHDHMTPEEYDVMFALQDQLLAKWNSA